MDLEQLPQDILFEICKYLSHKDMGEFSATCKYIYDLTRIFVARNWTITNCEFLMKWCKSNIFDEIRHINLFKEINSNTISLKSFPPYLTELVLDKYEGEALTLPKTLKRLSMRWYDSPGLVIPTSCEVANLWHCREPVTLENPDTRLISARCNPKPVFNYDEGNFLDMNAFYSSLKKYPYEIDKNTMTKFMSQSMPDHIGILHAFAIEYPLVAQMIWHQKKFFEFRHRKDFFLFEEIIFDIVIYDATFCTMQINNTMMPLKRQEKRFTCEWFTFDLPYFSYPHHGQNCIKIVTDGLIEWKAGIINVDHKLYKCNQKYTLGKHTLKISTDDIIFE